MGFKVASAVFMLLCSQQALAYYTQKSHMFTDDNAPIVINGISWSGFQDTNVFQGLQSNPLYAITASKRAYGMLDVLVADEAVPSSMGDFPLFKTVRIPIQPGVLYDDSNTVALNLSFTDSANPTQGNGLFCQRWATTWSGCQTAVSPKDAFCF